MSKTQALMLGDYQLGSIIGKGGYGSVFQGVNIKTGSYVAIKQIQLSKIPKDQLSGIVTEIDLLKKLDHPNIVKYLGYSKNSENLHIILEFVENGSLSNIVQKFGRFPESLARVYIMQVLTGLNYLHEQGVIHRDIKGANILTTKLGHVKLADFGVAVEKVNAKREQDCVVGTPYWMAPEIIELAGASTKSDIWSVGCTVIELLTGEPPYFDLPPMPALFRIVQDEHPPLPPDVSSALRDFLLECFRKDPNRRTTAEALLKHPWLRGTVNPIDTPALQVQNFEEVERSVQAYNKELDETKNQSVILRASSIKLMLAQGSDWKNQLKNAAETNEDLSWDDLDLEQKKTQPTPPKASPSSSSSSSSSSTKKTSGSSASPAVSDHDRKKKSDPKKESKERSTKPSSSSSSSSASSSGLSSSGSSSNTKKRDSKKVPPPVESWDDDFDDKPIVKKKESSSSSQDKAKKKPKKSSKSSETPSDPTKKKKKRSRDEKPAVIDEWDQLESPSPSKIKINSPRTKTATPSGSRGASKLSDSKNSPKVASPAPKPIAPPKKVEDDDGFGDDWDNAFPDVDFSPSGGSKSKTAPKNLNLSQELAKKIPSLAPVDDWDELDVGTIDLSKLKLSGDDGFGDEFDDGFDDFADFGAILQAKVSQNQTQAQDDIDEDALFNVFDDDDFRSRADQSEVMSEQIVKYLSLFDNSQPDAIALTAIDEMASLLREHKTEKHRIIKGVGVLPFVEIIEGINEKRIPHMLRLINELIDSNKEIQENMSLVGGYPVILQFCDHRYPIEVRFEVAKFVKHMTSSSSLSHQMFIACRGLPVLIGFLDTNNYRDNSALVHMAIDGIQSVFQLHSPTPKNDFCRLFAKCNALNYICKSLFQLLQSSLTSSPTSHSDNTVHINKLLDILLQFSNGDHFVKSHFVETSPMSHFLKSINLISSNNLSANFLVKLVKCLKFVSSDASILGALQKAGVIPIIIQLFDLCDKIPELETEPRNSLLQLLHNLTRIDQSRQEEAARGGVIPHLINTIVTNNPLKQLALEIFMDFGHVAGIRQYLWQHGAVERYLEQLSDWNWAASALDALISWLDDEGAAVEQVIVGKEANLKRVAHLLSESSNVMLVGLVESLLRLFGFSSIASALGSNERLRITPVIFERLSFNGHNAVVRVDLVKMLVCLFESHPNPRQFAIDYQLEQRLLPLTRDKLVIIQGLASRLLDSIRAL